MQTGDSHTATDQPLHLNDEVVFDRTYKSYYHPLCFYAAKFVSADDAEDIVENLFLRLWNKKQVFESTAHMQAFLYVAVKNACFDWIKVNKNAGQRHDRAAADSSPINEDHLDTLIKAEVLAEIYRAVNNLPAQCSKVIRMGYLEGLSNTEIAEQLGLSEQTVKNHKSRGLTILRENLSDGAFTLLLLLVHWK